MQFLGRYARKLIEWIPECIRRKSAAEFCESFKNRQIDDAIIYKLIKTPVKPAPFFSPARCDLKIAPLSPSEIFTIGKSAKDQRDVFTF